MAITIIDRMEQKYFISFEKFNKLMNLIKDKLVKDKYFDERIYNIYFDNDEYDLIIKSLDKPVYKEDTNPPEDGKFQYVTCLFFHCRWLSVGKMTVGCHCLASSKSICA